MWTRNFNQIVKIRRCFSIILHVWTSFAQKQNNCWKWFSTKLFLLYSIYIFGLSKQLKQYGFRNPLINQGKAIPNYRMQEQKLRAISFKFSMFYCSNIQRIPKFSTTTFVTLVFRTNTRLYCIFRQKYSLIWICNNIFIFIYI